VDLIIDHSVQVDRFGSTMALAHNAEREFERNRERYEFLKWASEVFDNFTVVPPATGICHQVNLEYLAKVVQTADVDGEKMAFPDTLLGTDSHTTMINGLGVLGWGVGGIEAEAAILGQPLYFRLPEVVGFKMTGTLGSGVTATDLVLAVTQRLREHGVVGKFVEYFGSGLDSLSLPDRATISNMCPEYGATAALFPVDELTLEYLALTGRSHLTDLVEKYTREQGIFRGSEGKEAEYTTLLELDLADVRPAIAGPKRPQDKIELPEAKRSFREFLDKVPREGSGAGAGADRTLGGGSSAGPATGVGAKRSVALEVGGRDIEIEDGSVVISAITSCTNTSNPSVMLGAALLAKKAVELGLRVPGHVKTSLAPGSRVVTRYLESSGLMPYLEALGYHLVGYGCTTCIGNSGPLNPKISKAILDNDIVATSVLSGNRNFEGRIHPEVRGNYLASPPLVIAYGLAGTMDIDLTKDPIGYDPNEEPVYLEDIWPSPEEIAAAVHDSITPEMYDEEYGNVYTGNETWNAIKLSGGDRYDWQDSSTYIRQPTFFEGLTRRPPAVEPIEGARALAMLGESVTTDHISPAGIIPEDSPAAGWLNEHGVERTDFNTYGSRRGNHEVMIRGTFGNIRIRNQLAPGTEGGYTKHLPDGEVTTIYEASQRYTEEGIPLIVIAGKDYGMGSSRDWAAKGTILLGVRAVIAESYERIHRSNLIGMGVLPLQFEEGENAAALSLTGEEEFDIEPVTEPGQKVQVTVRGSNGAGDDKKFTVTARVDTGVEMEYYRNGGILHTMLRKLAP
jgi:aconitate hydratase